MSDYGLFPARLAACLESVAGAGAEVRVYPDDPGTYSYFGSVTSPLFEGLGNGARQRLVWESILSRLDDRDQDRIAFVYTHSPSERLDTERPPESSAVPIAPALTS